MIKFKAGEYYTPSTVPSINALKCVKTTECFVWLYDEELEEEIKVKKNKGVHFNGKDLEEWEQVKVYGYLIRAIDN